MIMEPFENKVNETDIFRNKNLEFESEDGHKYYIDDFNVGVYLNWEMLDSDYRKAFNYAKKWTSYRNYEHEGIREIILDELTEEIPEITDIKYPKFHASISKPDRGLAISFKIYDGDEETAQDKTGTMGGGGYNNRGKKNYTHRGMYSTYRESLKPYEFHNVDDIHPIDENTAVKYFLKKSTDVIGKVGKQQITNVLIGTVSSVIAGIFMKLADTQLKKREIISRRRTEISDRDVREKLELIEKDEAELESELKKAEQTFDRLKSAVSAVRDKQVRKDLEFALERNQEKINIIKAQLNKI